MIRQDKRYQTSSWALTCVIRIAHYFSKTSELHLHVNCNLNAIGRILHWMPKTTINRLLYKKYFVTFYGLLLFDSFVLFVSAYPLQVSINLVFINQVAINLSQNNAVRSNCESSLRINIRIINTQICDSKR